MEPILRTGDKGAEVGNWQRFLLELGYLDANCEPLVPDEDFGIKTQWATKNYQLFEHLTPTGEVDATTRTLATLHGFIPFVQARNYTPVPGGRLAPTLIVIHTMEAPEKPKTAQNVAAWFSGPVAPQASAHYCLDNEETWQCVRESDVAWAAPGANKCGIHIEHAGFASQTPLQWDDEYSKAVLERSAELAAILCKRYGIPAEKVSPADLAAAAANGHSARGFCGHVDVTNGLNNGRGHQDPGAGWDWDKYLARVRELLGRENMAP